MVKYLAAFLILAILLAGCGSKFEGTYESGKDFLSIAGNSFSILTQDVTETHVGTYTIEGDYLLLRDTSGWTEKLRIVSDESLVGGMRIWRKK